MFERSDLVLRSPRANGKKRKFNCMFRNLFVVNSIYPNLFIYPTSVVRINVCQLKMFYEIIVGFQKNRINAYVRVSVADREDCCN